ncbi:MAG: peptidylprolyl isomerase [Planctomycetota bacterium]|nr:peptidylprolyl isomerase [Planctomycetota bacterium]
MVRFLNAAPTVVHREGRGRGAPCAGSPPRPGSASPGRGILSLPSCAIAILSLILHASGIPAARGGEPHPYSKEAVYARVDGRPITGEDVADFIARDRWDDAIEAYIERFLTLKAVSEAGIEVSGEAVEARIRRLAEMYSEEKGKRYSPETMMADLNVLPEEFRAEIRRELSVFELLKARGRLASGADISAQRTKAVIKAFLKELRDGADIVSDPQRLAAGEALRIDGRSISEREIRDFAVRSAGPPNREIIAAAVAFLKDVWTVENELRRLGLDFSRNDLEAHMDLIGRRFQIETGADDPRKAVEIFLASKGSSPDRLMRSPRFRLDAMVTKLAAREVMEDDARREFERNPGRYGSGEVKFGHLFVAVTDEEGRWFAPKGARTGIPAVDRAVEAKRARAFELGREKIERLKPKAEADWDLTVAEHSDDRQTSASKGQWGDFVGAKTKPRPPMDASVIRAALEAEVGRVVGPVESPYGWHLIKVFDRRRVEFEKVRELARAGAIDRAREAVIKRLQSKTRVEYLFSK